MSSIYDWSVKADDNGVADEDVIWVENQQPHIVNDSFRIMMSRIRGYLQDTGCAECSVEYIAVNPTLFKTNIRITSSSRPEAYANDMVFKFTTREPNIGVTTITVDNLPEAKVFKNSFNGVVPLDDRDIIPLNVYTIVYVGSGDYVGFHLMNPIAHGHIIKFDEYRFPTGMICAFATESVPDDWLPCDGSAYLKSDYPALYAYIGDRSWEYLDPDFVSDDPRLFHTPDFRGCFLSGAKDELGHVFGFTNFPDIRSHRHPGIVKTSRAVYHYFPDPEPPAEPVKIKDPEGIVNMSWSDLGFFRSPTYGIPEVEEDSFYMKAENAPPSRKKRAVDLFDLRALFDPYYKYFHDYYESYVGKATYKQQINYPAKDIGETDLRPKNVAITYGIKT